MAPPSRYLPALNSPFYLPFFNSPLLLCLPFYQVTAGSKLHAHKTKFSQSSSPKGAVYVQSSGTANLWECLFDSMKCSGVVAEGAGAIMLLDTCDFLGGTAPAVHLIHNEDWAIIRNTQFRGNSVQDAGGAIKLEGSSPLVVFSTFADNFATGKPCLFFFVFPDFFSLSQILSLSLSLSLSISLFLSFSLAHTHTHTHTQRTLLQRARPSSRQGTPTP